MFEIAFAIGIFSYTIYFLGLLGLLYKPLIIVISILFWIGFFVLEQAKVRVFLKYITDSFKNKLFLLVGGYIVLQALVNGVGLLGPEIGFDATWYHLTLPKLYLMYHAVMHIPGGILYYADMPKLTEMLYAAGLSFGSDFFARGTHFLFGLLTCVAIYKLGKKFFSPSWALLLPVIFYSNLVVGWESISGYIDLSRTFFTTVSLLAFFTWLQTKEKKYLIFSGIFVGLTTATKLLALPDILIYTLVLLFVDRHALRLPQRLRRIGIFLACVLVCLLPYLTFSFIHTGNPIYPMLSSAYKIDGYWEILNPFFLVSSIWSTFAVSSDPIHPLFLALFPFYIMYAKKLWKKEKILSIFALGGIICWYITPQTGGGRYILPYLTALSVVSIWLIQQLSRKWQRLFILFIGLVALISLGYRALAVAKFVPVILRHESKATFMTSHLQYNLGDFYDIDGYFAKHIKSTDRVLLYGFHNLYYVDFPFIDNSWVQKGDRFDFVAVQGKGMPARFADWNLIYLNNTTQVRLYSLKGHMWRY